MKFLRIFLAGGQQQPRLQLPAARRRRISQSLLALFLLIDALPASTAPWTVEARPATLLNGAPVLFEVNPPVKLDSLGGSWLGHQLSFNYNATTKTWFALAGVSLETNPGRYALELTGLRTATQKPLTFTSTFLVARALYPKIKVQLSVEKKF